LAASTFPDAALPLRNALSPFIVDERIQPGRGGVRLTVFHLVQKQAVAAYIEAADATSGTIGPWHMSLTGPWPPFAFAPELSS
jgi:gas vesicle protein GvpL/GvpF